MHLLRGHFLSLLALIILLPFTAAAQTATPPPVPPAPAQQIADSSQPRLHLGGGDLIDVVIFGVPDLSSKGRISNEGEFYMPLVGYSKLAGLNVEEAQAL